MLTPLKGLKLGRRGALIGLALSAVTATAVGAASGHTPWPEPTRPSFATSSEPPPDVAVTTIATIAAPIEPVIDTTVAAPEVSPDVVEPATTPAPAIAPPAAPASTEPVVVEPTPAPPVIEPAVTEEPAVEPAADPEPAAEPASPPHDNVVPATLQLSCVSDSPSGPVACSWSGETPSGFASFVLLRGDPDGKGRVPYRSTDAGGNSFVDGSAAVGSHSYVLVALDTADHPLAHSNMVLVQIAAA